MAKTWMQTIQDAFGGSDATLTSATGTAASSGDNTLIAAQGAGIKIYIVGLIIQNESTTATTAILKFGSTNKLRVLNQAQGDGISVHFGGRAWPVDANTALVLNLSGANSHGYTVIYYTGV